MPPGLKQWPPWACCVCRGVFKIAWMQYSSVTVASQVSVWAWQASRRDTVSHVTSAVSSSSSSLFDVKECTEIAFQSVHAHWMRTVSMCNPCCHSDRNPPVILRVSLACATGGRCFLTASLVGCDEEAMSPRQRGETDVWTGCTPRWKDKQAAITITSWTFGSYKDATLKSVFMTPIIGH